MNFQLSEEQRLIQETAKKFANSELVPGAIERDEKKIPLEKLHEEAVANMETIHVDDL